MRILNRLRAILVVVIKRVTSQPWLVVATTLGLVVAIALMMSIPTYANAVYHRIFLRNIAEEGAPEGTIPPLDFLFRYDGSIYGSKEWEDLRAVDTYLTHEAGDRLGLPLISVVRYMTTDPFGLFADRDSAFNNTMSPLVWASFAFISDVENHIIVTEGRFPAFTPLDNSSATEVMIHEDLATSLGFQVDESYIAYIRVRADDGFVKDLQIPVRIVGIWIPEDPSDSFWFFRPRAFSERLLVPEETFAANISARMEKEVYTAVWSIMLDGQNINHNDAMPLVRRTLAVRQRAAGLLPNTTLGKSPLDALVSYQRSSNLLTVLLYAFSVPILGLLLAFITLTAALATERRRNEVAVLRSRGAMAAQMVGIAMLEGLLLGGIALALSSPVAMLIAQLIGQTRSFLDFSAGLAALRVTLTGTTLRFGAIGVLIGIVAQLLPTLSAAGHTVVSYKREVARMLRKPWWQRVWLDVLLLIPAGYGAYLLRNQGSVVELTPGLTGNPLQNPLLFLVPALGIFALTLFFLRLMPLMMSAVAWIAARTRSVGLLMAARHLARTPSFYNTPLILLVLTLSLSAFTASLAHTLDQHLYDKTYYQAGADMRFMDRGEGTNPGGMGGFLGGGGETNAAQDEGPRWYFLPVSEYLNAPGVEAVTRVAVYPAIASSTTGRHLGTFMGLDRAQFPGIGFWRQDFASQSLGALMNSLAVQRNGVLVNDEFLRTNILDIGDSIRIEVTAYGQRTFLDLTVAGTFKYFPTWYPSKGPLFVGDADYFFEQAGEQLPYGVWMGVAPETDISLLVEEELSIFSHDWLAPGVAIAREQELPERQGLFGLLSVGFAAAAALTVIGFLLYALFSFRRRFIEFGVLRAVGLSSRHMTAFLTWELAFLILIGGGLGTALGGFVSQFFIPFLQIGVDEVSRIPPYVVDIAWAEIFRIYQLFAMLFVVALVALGIMLRRMRIFEAVKLGETA
jgi:putative ABC transport system permease protein